MKHWRFLDYHSESGTNLIQEWYARQDEREADFDVILNVLSATQNWNGRKDCRPLKRSHAGLWEIRFTVNKIRYRPVGFFGPGSGEFTLLLGCSKRIRGNYTPSNAFDLALELRRKLIEEGKGRINDHE